LLPDGDSIGPGISLVFEASLNETVRFEALSIDSLDLFQDFPATTGPSGTVDSNGFVVGVGVETATWAESLVVGWERIPVADVVVALTLTSFDRSRA